MTESRADMSFWSRDATALRAIDGHIAFARRNTIKSAGDVRFRHKEAVGSPLTGRRRVGPLSRRRVRPFHRRRRGPACWRLDLHDSSSIARVFLRLNLSLFDRWWR